MTFDIVCTRLQAYTCVNKRGCGLFDPRFDDADTYWKERDSTPSLINVKTQPTIDCIDFDSTRAALVKGTDDDYFGVEQEEAWFNEFREDDPNNMGQMLIRIDADDTATPHYTVTDFIERRFSSIEVAGADAANANDDYVTAVDSMSNKFADQVAKEENWGNSSPQISNADYPTRIDRKPKFLYIKHGDYVCNDGFVYMYRQDIVNSFDWTYRDVGGTHDH